MNVDLHIHTTISDGTSSPEDIVYAAAKNEIDIIAITDHDTLFHSYELTALAQEQQVTLIPGVEISAAHSGHSIHVLGYFIDDSARELKTLVDTVRTNRDTRNHEMIEKCNRNGLPITMEELEEIAQGEIVSRPHFARLFVQKKLVPSYNHAFMQYLANGAQCHVSRTQIPAASVIQEINAAGGMSVLAHPCLIPCHTPDEYTILIHDLKECGLQGLEVFCANQPKKTSDLFLSIAHKEQLMITGGSDFHGNTKPTIMLGDFYGVNRIFEYMRPEFIKRGYYHE